MIKARKISIILWLILWLLPLCVSASPVETFATSSAVNPDKCAVLIIDIKTGKVLEEYNADLSLVPASVNKVATIASLLPKTGLKYRYQTKVYLSGKVKNGILDGNLVIVGGGDPTLGTSQAPAGSDFINAIVKALNKKKITEIKGNIIVDCDIFPEPATPPSWAAGDLSCSYGTGCHGFNWQHNASGKSAVKDPIAKFRQTLTDALTRHDINVCGEEILISSKGKELLTYESENIAEIMRYCMKESDNLYAETFMRTLAVVNDKPGSTEQGAAIATQYWKKKGMPMSGVNIVDGSGLSRSNRLTARFLGKVLTVMASNADYASFFPLAGIEGTVKNFLKNTPLEDYIALKTGSMRGIQCYAGYKVDDDYAPTHAVVIIVNDFKGDRANVKNAVKRLLIDTFVGLND